MALENIEWANGHPLFQRVWDHYAAGKSIHDWHSEAVLEVVYFNRGLDPKSFEKVTDCVTFNIADEESIIGAYLSWQEYDAMYCVGLLTETRRTPEENEESICGTIDNNILCDDAITDEIVYQTAQNILNHWKRVQLLAEFFNRIAELEK